VVLRLAWTNATLIDSAFTGFEGASKGITYCDIYGGAKATLKVKLWRPNQDKWSQMDPYYDEIYLSDSDFPGDAEKTENIWPILVHKVEEKHREEQSTMINDKGEKIGCDGYGGKDICAIGSLISRFTGVHMKADEVVRGDPQAMVQGDPQARKWTGVLSVTTKFPVVLVTNKKKGDWMDLWSKEETEERLIHTNQDEENRVEFTSPDPQTQKGKSFEGSPYQMPRMLIDESLDGEDYHSYIVYPVDFAERSKF
jgi:hypothetical protein